MAPITFPSTTIGRPPSMGSAFGSLSTFRFAPPFSRPSSNTRVGRRNRADVFALSNATSILPNCVFSSRWNRTRCPPRVDDGNRHRPVLFDRFRLGRSHHLLGLRERNRRTVGDRFLTCHNRRCETEENQQAGREIAKHGSLSCGMESILSRSREQAFACQPPDGPDSRSRVTGVNAGPELLSGGSSHTAGRLVFCKGPGGDLVGSVRDCSSFRAAVRPVKGSQIVANGAPPVRGHECDQQDAQCRGIATRIER